MIFLFPLGKGDTSRGDGRQTHCDGKPLQSVLFPISLPLSSPLFCLLFRAGGGRVGECGWVGGCLRWGGKEVGGGTPEGGGSVVAVAAVAAVCVYICV